jgi:hypothetical protein
MSVSNPTSFTFLVNHHRISVTIVKTVTTIKKTHIKGVVNWNNCTAYEEGLVDRVSIFGVRR